MSPFLMNIQTLPSRRLPSIQIPPRPDTNPVPRKPLTKKTTEKKKKKTTATSEPSKPSTKKVTKRKKIPSTTTTSESSKPSTKKTTKKTTTKTTAKKKKRTTATTTSAAIRQAAITSSLAVYSKLQALGTLPCLPGLPEDLLRPVIRPRTNHVVTEPEDLIQSLCRVDAEDDDDDSDPSSDVDPGSSGHMEEDGVEPPNAEDKDRAMEKGRRRFASSAPNPTGTGIPTTAHALLEAWAIHYRDKRLRKEQRREVKKASEDERNRHAQPQGLRLPKKLELEKARREAAESSWTMASSFGLGPGPGPGPGPGGFGFGAPSGPFANTQPQVSPAPNASPFAPSPMAAPNPWATATSTSTNAAATPFASTPTSNPTGNATAAGNLGHPFGTMNNAAASAANPFARASTATPPAANPFGAPTNPPQQLPSASSPFTTAPQQNQVNPWAPAPSQQAANPFGSASQQQPQQPTTQFGAAPSLQQMPTAFGSTSASHQHHQPGPFAGASQPQAANPFGGPSQQGQSAPPSRAPKKTVHFADDTADTAMESAAKRLKPGPSHQPSEQTTQLSAFAARYAEKVHAQLRTDHVQYPRWPSDPGNPKNRAAVDKVKDYYKKYRSKVYESLRKAELIADPDKRRRLEDALPFKGICEDMCPDWEQVQRMTEFDVKPEEKVEDPGGSEMWVDPGRMVKKFGRSAAGQEAPLPMDIRSISALKKSTDYLLGELLRKEEDLPRLHGYLWDRTRSVRKDFAFHTQKTAEEIQVMVYCFETIARFHAVSLHLLSRKGFALDSFNQQQEREQLQNSLKSLMQFYDDCHGMGLPCANEAEFRAYYLVIYIGDPFSMEQAREWKNRPWYSSSHMKIAESIVTSLQSPSDSRGPIHSAPGSPFTAPTFTKFFDLVNNKGVSYTMACVAEIHFTKARRHILQAMVKAYSRKRDWPKDITPRILNEHLRFDTDQEAMDFVELHGFEFERRSDASFAQADADSTFLSLKNKHKRVNSEITVRQSHSAKIVESKRDGGQTLAQIFRAPIYRTKDAATHQANGRAAGMGSSNLDEHDKEALQYTGPMSAGEGDMFLSNPQYEQYAEAKKRQEMQELKERALALVKENAAKRNAIAQTQQQNGPPPATASWTPASSVSGAPSNTAQPPNGVSKSGPAANPFQSFANPPPAAATPAQPPNVAAPANPFQPSTSAQGAGPGVFTPTSASAPTGGSVFAGNTQTPPTTTTGSIFSNLPKQAPSNPFAGFTPSATTPVQDNKSTERGSEAKADQSTATTTPQPSVFASLASKTSTPATSIFSQPTSTPATQSAPASSTPATGSSDVSTQPKPAAPSGFTLGNYKVTAQPIFPPTSQSPASGAAKPVSVENSSDAALQSTTSTIPATSVTQQLTQPTATPTATLPKPAAPKENPMVGLTKWFVNGDGGLMGDFTEFFVTNIVEEAFQKYKDEEEARVRKEEDDASWAAAREHMTYRLSVKYLDRWRQAARRLAQTRILREGVAKRQAYYEDLLEKEKAKKQAAERKAAEKARQERVRELNFTAADDLERIIREQQRSRQVSEEAMLASAEEALLATGVFSGMKDEKAAARRAVQGAQGGRSTYHKRTASCSSRPASSQSLDSRDMAPPPKKEGWKTRSLREMFGKSRSDRRSESFGSSIGSGGASSPNYFRHSMPVHGGGAQLAGHHNKPRTSSDKVTNFSFSSRKRSAETSDDEPTSKKKSVLSGRPLHWELRARGLVCMPDGRWLPESIAIPMQEGKRYPGIGDCGLGPGKPDPVFDGEQEEQHYGNGSGDGNKKENSRPTPTTTQQSPEDRRKSKLDALAKRFGFPPSRRSNYSANGGGTPRSLGTPASPASSLASLKRRHAVTTDGEDHDHADEDQDDSPSRNKRPRHPADTTTNYSHLSADEETQARVRDTRRMLREMEAMMDTLDGERRDRSEVYSEGA